MNKIKVIHFITKLELGGAQLNTIYTYEHLDESRFEVYLVCGPGGILTSRVQKRDRLIIIEDVGREIDPRQDWRALRRLKKILSDIQPHILHTHSSKAGIIGRAAAAAAASRRRDGFPITVHSVHGFPFSPFQSFLKRKIYEGIEKIAGRSTNHFIFVARDDIAIAQAKGILANATGYSLIRSGFPLRDFQAQAGDTAALRQHYHIPPGAFVCGTIAPFKAQKGLFHLIDIAQQVISQRPGVFFFIAGDGAMRPAMESELARRGILENFRLPGFLFDIATAIDIFDLGITTALWEGLPQSLVQLRLKKKAVVASDIPGNREVIEDNRNGYLVDVADHGLFAEKILALIENREERQRLAQAEEDFAQWDADFMVKAQEDLYGKLYSTIHAPLLHT